MSRVALLLRALEYKPTEACSSPLGGLGRGEGGRRETGGRRASPGLERGGEVAKLLFWDLGTRKSRAPGPVYGPVDLQLNLEEKREPRLKGLWENGASEIGPRPVDLTRDRGGRLL
jgi:hypothetical protein